MTGHYYLTESRYLGEPFGRQLFKWNFKLQTSNEFSVFFSAIFSVGYQVMGHDDFIPVVGVRVGS